MSVTSTTSFEEIVARVHRLLGVVADLVGDRSLLDRAAREDVETVHQAIVNAESAVRAYAAGNPREAERVGVVLTELGSLRLSVQAHELCRRRGGLVSLNQSLHRLRAANSIDELAALVPREVAGLGFNRVLFSWVEQARWVPESVFTASGPEEARAVLEAGQPPYLHTRDLLEAEMIRRRRPMLVHDALGNPHVHLDIQAVMHSHSYVAAPLISRSNVVGFVHADQNVDTDTVDEFDRDLVTTFTEGLGLAFERVSVLEELASVRSRLGRQAAALRDLMSELDGAEVGTQPPRHPADDEAPLPAARTSVAWGGDLTRREEQVLQLVAGGLSNAQIAARLYVTEGTAKTHVKNVLRKLGAENRVQAGAMYHRHAQQA
jgi:DNA-binding CsgD family transcriptional regulator/GAF domain-containing protein